jgi:hypothetical protein
MAKAQGKKAAVSTKKSAAKKPAARVKTAKTAKKPAAPKKPAKPAKPASRVAKPVAAVKKAVAKVAAKLRPKAAPAAAPAAKAKAAPPPPPAARKPEPEKKRTRRPRPRVHSNGAPVANWLTQGEKPRPSSFIPAPARAEAPSLIAAPPASSDRLFRADDFSEIAVRTVPVRVDVEMNGGRVYIGIFPEEVTLRVGEGIEWDFRYLGGADVTVDELFIEFEKPAPFSHASFRSRKPGSARPHRQMSGPAQASAAGKKLRYTVRAVTAFNTDIGVAKPSINVQA